VRCTRAASRRSPASRSRNKSEVSRINGRWGITLSARCVFARARLVVCLARGTNGRKRAQQMEPLLTSCVFPVATDLSSRSSPLHFRVSCEPCDTGACRNRHGLDRPHVRDVSEVGELPGRF